MLGSALRHNSILLTPSPVVIRVSLCSFHHSLLASIIAWNLFTPEHSARLPRPRLLNPLNVPHPTRLDDILKFAEYRPFLQRHSGCRVWALLIMCDSIRKLEPMVNNGGYELRDHRIRDGLAHAVRARISLQWPGP